MVLDSFRKLNIQIIQGMTLPGLLRVLARNGFRVDMEHFPRLAYLLLLGAFNSVFGFAETVLDGKEIKAVEVNSPPLFILGHWRSGTTHLHNLMSIDENFAAPSAFQALFPHHFIFSQSGGALFNLIAPPKRPMDNVAFGADVPHEDEFGLAAHSGVSPYFKTWFPVTGDSVYCQLDLRKLPIEKLEKWKDSLRLFLMKFTLSEGKRAVLKSPPHTARIGTLLEMYPDAQFIHIVRDPYAVYASTHKLFQNTMAYAHLQTVSNELIDELILSWYEEMFSLYRRDRDLVPEGALHELKFEDLEANPIESLKSMYDNLGLEGFDAFRERVSLYLKSIEGYQKNVHHLNESDREKVYKRWRRTFDEYDYPR